MTTADFSPLALAISGKLNIADSLAPSLSKIP
jgi:hypothetical protein